MLRVLRVGAVPTLCVRRQSIRAPPTGRALNMRRQTEARKLLSACMTPGTQGIALQLGCALSTDSYAARGLQSVAMHCKRERCTVQSAMQEQNMTRVEQGAFRGDEAARTISTASSVYLSVSGAIALQSYTLPQRNLKEHQTASAGQQTVMQVHERGGTES